MTQLTREYFDQQLKKLATKQDIRDAADELARITNAGFAGVDRQFAEVIRMLDVRKRVEKIEQKFQKLESALNFKL